MTDGSSGPVERPARGRGRWTSFVAEPPGEDRPARTLHEAGDPRHRVRVEHDAHTLLIHLSDEEGPGWTTVAVDRATRAWAVAQRDSQLAAAAAASGTLYAE
ncbi:hypothetical protein OF117_06385 [Geodermatophilus sp. YIM 151500]|uniref:hypothetical protein n=1 Tax=Geodermatophilus sp. YIM 151500 TaxID=2984531 RepID=UPI0021E4D013|nr:hypothetical protein [Geodermatophilus sp. YIM 151500]MCV2488985.1 hypothetical protein [Geodermatophilus sp. YIM 151500]